MWKLICLLFSIVYVRGQGGNSAILPACKSTDVPCLRTSTKEFMLNTAQGIPQFNVTKMDPLTLSKFEINLEKNDGALISVDNAIVTGLRNLTASDFRMDTKAKSVNLTSGTFVIIEAPLSMKFSNNKVYTGRFTAKGDVRGSTLYTYDLTKDGSGVEHFIVGPEIIVPEVDDKFIYIISWNEESLKDPDFQELSTKWSPYKKEISKLIIEQIVKKSYAIVIHNLRIVATLLPKTSFFIDV